MCLRDLRLLLLPHHDGLPAELADGERDVSPRYAKDGVDEIARLRCAKALWSAIKSPAYPQLRLGGNPLHAMHRISCRESPLFSHKVREEGGIDGWKVKGKWGVPLRERATTTFFPSTLTPSIPIRMSPTAITLAACAGLFGTSSRTCGPHRLSGRVPAHDHKARCIDEWKRGFGMEGGGQGKE